MFWGRESRRPPGPNSQGPKARAPGGPKAMATCSGRQGPGPSLEHSLPGLELRRAASAPISCLMTSSTTCSILTLPSTLSCWPYWMLFSLLSSSGPCLSLCTLKKSLRMLASSTVTSPAMPATISLTGGHSSLPGSPRQTDESRAAYCVAHCSSRPPHTESTAGYVSWGGGWGCYVFTRPSRSPQPPVNICMLHLCLLSLRYQ